MADLSKDAGASGSASSPAFGAPWLPHRLYVALLVLLIGTGVLVRVLPSVQGRDLLVRQPSEDGYLMLTVARNMAIGLGMSSAAGTMPTNGVQPLATFVFAGCFLLSGGDKDGGVALVMALSVLISLLSLLAVYRLGKVVFSKTPHGQQLAGLAAAMWFASPIITEHSMNALETGIYYLVVALTLHYFLVHAADPQRDLPWPKVAVLGALLGLAFWARNDAIFLIVALAGARLLLSLRLPPPVIGRRVVEGVALGLMAGLVASPWMVFNQRNFGSIVPVSGHAQSGTRLFENLIWMPGKLVEYLTVTGAIPGSVEAHKPLQFVFLLVAFAAIYVAVRYCLAKSSVLVRTATAVGLIHTVVVVSYYGVFFGAAHFLSRYTSPLSILIAFFTVGVAMQALRDPRWTAARMGFAVTLTVLAMLLDVRLYRAHQSQMHFQVVEWVNANVPPETWVGAIQTGTLGFFHDRTINLDGKTNPAALKNRGPEKMRPYLLSTEIQYLADWTGIGTWVSFMAPEFKLIVDDQERNLAVLKRVN